MNDNLRDTLRFLSRSAFVMACLISAFMIVLNFTLQFLNTEYRLLIIMGGSLPALFFVFSHLLYEGQASVSFLNNRVKILSFLTVCVLLLPMLILVVRFRFFDVDRLMLARSFSLITLTSLLGMMVDVNDTSNVGQAFLGHLHRIMWRVWDEGRPESMEAMDLSDNEIRGNREVIYNDKETIGVFQRSVSCASTDCDATIELIRDTIDLTAIRHCSVVDIGGGDGQLTANILRELSSLNWKTSDIRMIDPVNWKDEYTHNLGAVGVDIDRITFDLSGVDDFVIRQQYDVVVASHSLYSGLDSISDAANRAGIIDRVLSLRKDDGVAVISLASRAGQSYIFKDKALRMYYGKEIKDVAAEDINLLLPSHNMSQTRIDAWINLTQPIKAYEKGNPEELASWLEYFLRMKVRGDAGVLKKLVALLDKYIVPLGSMDEKMLERYRQVHGACPADDIILPHKVKVYCVGPLPDSDARPVAAQLGN